MTLIVVSQLTTKEGLYFRYLTSAMKLHYNMDVIVEAQTEQIDYYYALLKKRGLYDFVSEIVTPEMREETKNTLQGLAEDASEAASKEGGLFDQIKLLKQRVEGELGDITDLTGGLG